MKADEFLKSAQSLSNEIKALTGAVERIEDEYEAARKSACPADMLNELCLRKTALKADVSSRITRLFAVKQEIFTCVSRLKSEQERTYLIMRYVNNMTNEQIAEMCCYDERTVYRVQKKALKSLNELLAVS